MTITRRSLHDEIDILDQQIAELQRGKAEMFDAYREQLAAAGLPKTQIRDELDAFKKAQRKLRALAKDEVAVFEKESLVDEIVAELQRSETGTRNALTRATREPRRTTTTVTHSGSAPSTVPPAPEDSGEAAPDERTPGGAASPNPAPNTSIITPTAPISTNTEPPSVSSDDLNNIPGFLDRRGEIHALH